MSAERTDPLAAQMAVMALDAALRPVIEDEMHRIGLSRRYSSGWPDARVIAEAVVGMHVAQVERFAGLRRVVLYGPLEVDPAEVRAA
jgi:hypothetical protein